MNQVQKNYAEVQLKWDEAMAKLDAGVKVDDAALDALEDEILDAEDALKDWVKPILVAEGLNGDEVENLFLRKTDEAIALTMKLKA